MNRLILYAIPLQLHGEYFGHAHKYARQLKQYYLKYHDLLTLYTFTNPEMKVMQTGYARYTRDHLNVDEIENNSENKCHYNQDNPLIQLEDEIEKYKNLIASYQDQFITIQKNQKKYHTLQKDLEEKIQILLDEKQVFEKELQQYKDDLMYLERKYQKSIQKSNDYYYHIQESDKLLEQYRELFQYTGCFIK